MTKRSQSTERLAAPDDVTPTDARLNRRSFLERGTVAGLATLLPIGTLMTAARPVSARGILRTTDIV